MTWRIQVSERPIQRLDVLTGRPTILAAWTAPNAVSFLDLQHGTKRDERSFEALRVEDRRTDKWQAFTAGLKAPNGVFLPLVRLPHIAIHATADGKMRLYRLHNGGWFFEVDGKETPVELEAGARFVAVDFDRTLGLLAALDQDARLHIYQQHMRVGAFKTDLTLGDEFQPMVVIAQGGTTIYLSDGQRILQFSPTGRMRQRLDLHYTLGALACSATGRMVAASDLESGVIRVYGADLTPTHQRFAADILADARRVQLLMQTTAGAALGPLAINNKGVLAFALAGTVCVTNLAKLKALPRPGETTETFNLPALPPKGDTPEPASEIASDE